IRPMAMPTHSGTANRSPVRLVNCMERLTHSTAISPPISPPTMVLPPHSTCRNHRPANTLRHRIALPPPENAKDQKAQGVAQRFKKQMGMQGVAKDIDRES